MVEFNSSLPSAATKTAGLWSSWVLYNVFASNVLRKELISPLKEILDSENATISAKFTNTWVPSWWDLVQNMPAIENIGTERSIRPSRFIPRRAVEQDLDLLAETFERIGPKDNAPTVSMLYLYIFT